jgi:hypothetical protein
VRIDASHSVSGVIEVFGDDIVFILMQVSNDRCCYHIAV